jgi:predicted nucleotidyltransferase
MKKNQKIKRKTADVVLTETIQIAKEINVDDHYLYGISEISIFGSYLKSPDKDYIGDLDLMVKLVRKKLSWKDNEQIPYKFQQAQKERPYLSHLQAIFYAWDKTIRKLKHRSRTLSIHNAEEEGGRLGEEKVVFTCDENSLIIKEKLY